MPCSRSCSHLAVIGPAPLSTGIRCDMNPVFIHFLGILASMLGCYLLFGLAFPRLRHWSWRNDPAGLVGSCAAFSVLLGLYGLGVGRPYTWIAAIALLGVGLVMAFTSAVRHPELIRPLKSVAKRREFIIGVLLVNCTGGSVVPSLGMKASPAPNTRTTGGNAGGPRPLPIRTPDAARIAQFRR